MRDFYNLTEAETLDKLGSDADKGLNERDIEAARKNHGENVLSRKKPKSLLKRIVGELTEPMMLILLVALAITLTVNIVTAVKGAGFDWIELVGITAAIAVSVFLSVFMEGRSAKAYAALKKIGGGIRVKCIRGGKSRLLDTAELVVGDVIEIAAGDKIPADCRLLNAHELYADESPLTGESAPVHKRTDAIADEAPLAERKNMIYSGCFVTEGTGRAVVTAVGDRTELGRIAGGLEEGEETPIQIKLRKLGKRIALFGSLAAALVFVVQLVKLIVRGGVTFAGVSDIFITSIVLIVASVPEGLPTIVAVSLALNVIKMARENALVKKMVACETVGCISVICSDKTGTLTMNKMKVAEIVAPNGRTVPPDGALAENICVNSTADLGDGGAFIGNPTECALLSCAADVGIDYRPRRTGATQRFPFSSDLKRMTTVAGGIAYTKGAPETVLSLCDMTPRQRATFAAQIETRQSKAMRVIAFAHKPFAGGSRQDAEQNLIFDGFAAISDPVRPEVYAAVRCAHEAGIDVKMLTGDNVVTAAAIAEELGLAHNGDGVYSARQIEEMTDAELTRMLPSIRAVARSTPATKLRVVKALKAAGEVVALTGDGINDAPAITAADVGIAMGSGTEVSKQAADIVLLDDSFKTIVGAVQWGRGIYENFQRFILFQLSVNVAAVAVVILCTLFDLATPFNALMLLWINLIMDGPPALTLGLEKIRGDIMRRKPTRRNASIVTKRMFVRIFTVGLFMAATLILQMLFNFMRIVPEQEKTFVFTVFVLFQIFNAFNARELGEDSLFKNLLSNKPMLCVMAATLGLQVLITQFGTLVFDTVPLGLTAWLKAFALSLSIVVFTEVYKVIMRPVKKVYLRRKAVAA